jgi:hypothetical protein
MRGDDARWQGAIALVLLAVMGLELAHLFAGLPAARAGVHVAMLALVVVAAPRLGLREAYLLALSGGLTLALWWLHPRPAEIVRLALDQAAFLMAFILLISLVQEGARTSPSVAAAGNYLARQPGSRRFLALYAGSNLMSPVFNLGTVSLIAPLVRRAAEEAPDDPLTPVRERRQLSAILRGFAWSVVWSPTAVAPLAVMQLIGGIDRGRWIALGAVLAAVMMGIGWLEDRWRWRRFTARDRGVPPPASPPFPGRAFLGFGAVCLAFAGLTAAILALTGQRVPPSLMAAAPLLLAGWIAVQRRARPDGGTVLGPTLRQLGRIARDSLPLSAPAAVTLACSGYVGRAAAELVPAAALAERVGLDVLPGWVFLTAVAVGVALLAQLALSPIMMAVFFGSLLGALPNLPASPTLTALAISCGWALSMTCAPFASIVILMTRMTGHPGTRLTWAWNTRFTALAAITLTAAFALLTGGR